jgi:hypothetical protein
MLSLVIAAGALAVVWQHFRVDREFHALYMLLSRARTRATMAGPITVRFTDHAAYIEGPDGSLIESQLLVTLSEVRYQTTRGDRRIVFDAGGPTNPYNVHLHGGDVTLRAWTGHERALWVHCTGGITEGRNDDWTLNHR